MGHWLAFDECFEVTVFLKLNFLLENPTKCYLGLDINEPDALSPSKWRGKNKLGQILTEIREELWSKPEYANEVS